MALDRCACPMIADDQGVRPLRCRGPNTPGCRQYPFKVTSNTDVMQGHAKPCYYCQEGCDSLAANPSRWPIPMCHADDPGRVKWHHIGCVAERVRDGERYRFMRNLQTDPYQDETPHVVRHRQDSWGNWRNDVLVGEELDKAIDKARGNDSM